MKYFITLLFIVLTVLSFFVFVVLDEHDDKEGFRYGRRRHRRGGRWGGNRWGWFPWWRYNYYPYSCEYPYGNCSGIYPPYYMPY